MCVECLLRHGQPAVDNPFKYQGKEMQDEIFAFGGDTSKLIRLNLYDFHARQYDPVLGRWHVPDPVMQHASPYLAMGNNPVSMVDPAGLRSYDPCRNVAGGIYLGRLFRNIANGISSFADLIDGLSFGMAGGPGNYTDDGSWDFSTVYFGRPVLAADFTPHSFDLGTGGGGDRSPRGGSGPVSAQVKTVEYPGEPVNSTYGLPQYMYREPYRISRKEGEFVRNPQGQRGAGLYGNAKVGAIPETNPFYSSQFTLHYMFGDGSPLHLSDKGFRNIYNKAVKNKAIEWNTINSLGNNRYSVSVNFYNTSFDLKNAFGRATFYLQYDNGQFRPTGFYDYWDLDSKASGVRPGSAESTTRFFNSILNGTPFKIIYP